MSITELIPNRKYKVTVWGRKLPNGHRPRFTATVHGGIGAARAKERELYRLRDAGGVPHSGTTLATYLTGYLHQRKFELAPQTVAGYEQQAARCAGIGGLKLSDVTPVAVRHLYQRLSSDNLAPSTIGHVHRFLSMALKRAALDGLIAGNPCALVKPPKVERSAATALDEAYAFKLLHDLDGSPVWLPAYLGIATGLREGEMLALQWGDIDLKQGTLTVTHSLEQVGREVRRKETKTARSRRTVAIGPDLCRELVSHRRHLKERRLRLANFWHESGYVFPSLHHVGEHLAGRAWSPGAFKASWRKATRSAGWQLRYHDLRHTHATLLMRAGLPANEVAAQLGHSGTGLVLDLYGHVHTDRRRAVVDVVDAALG